MKKSVFVMLAVLLCMMFSACSGGGDKLRTGDLVFVGLPMDYGADKDSMAGAISASTGDDSLNIIHVSILEVGRDTTWIIDATMKHGVDRHPIDTFFTDFRLRDGSMPVFLVKRPDVTAAQAEEFVRKAKLCLGQPYDSAFLPDNGAMYCSELVRESYVLDDGSHLFSEYPMNFLGPDGQMPPYWTRLFARLGMDVPQGVRGTNPQKMATEPSLRPLDVSL